MVKRIKHDIYLQNLYERIKPEYDSVSKNVRLFSKRGRVIAEIDILATRENICDVYEVKCSYRITKARKQLARIKRLLPYVDGMFFFCGESGMLRELDVE